MFLLSGYRRNMSVTQRLLLFRGGTRIDPTVATVVADTIHRDGVYDGRVVYVVDVGNIHIVH
jgi:hypothetical protein